MKDFFPLIVYVGRWIGVVVIFMIMNDGETDEFELKRRTRNQSEKRRRDAFNKLIIELTAMLGDKSKKLDKSNVLKQAITYLYSQRTKAESATHDGSYDCLPKYAGTTTKEIARLYLEALDAGTFIICISDGSVQFASNSFASIFGLEMNSIKGQSLHSLITDESTTAFNQSMSAELVRVVKSNQMSIGDGTVKVTVTTAIMEQALLVGRLQRVDCPPSSHSQFSRNLLCLVGVGRPLEIAGERFYFADDRHSLGRSKPFLIVFNAEWTIVDLSNRLTCVTGYSRYELLGTSGYDLYHVDDLEQIVSEHRQLLIDGSLRSRPHRLLGKSGHWLWLQCDMTLDRTENLTRIRCLFELSGRDSSLDQQSNSVVVVPHCPPSKMESKRKNTAGQPAAYIEQYPLPAKRCFPGSNFCWRTVLEQQQQKMMSLRLQMKQKALEHQQQLLLLQHPMATSSNSRKNAS